MRPTRAAQMIGLLAVGLFSAALFAAEEQRPSSYPEPSIIPKSWELDVKVDVPAVISVQLPTDEKPKLYYYLTYSVSNRTGEEQLFVPDFEMLTDAGDLLRGNRGVPNGVFKRIRDRVRNPLLLSPSEIVGKILQGPDQARDGVAIWPVPDHDVNQLRIFFIGLSGETHTVTDPVTGEQRLLRKTLALDYHTPGDESHAHLKPFVAKGKQWVIR